MRYNNVGIKGTGSYLPSKIVTNYDIQEKIDTTHEWIHSKLGINERRIVVDEFPSDMGYEAAKKALLASAFTTLTLGLLKESLDFTQSGFNWNADDYGKDLATALLGGCTISFSISLF